MKRKQKNERSYNPEKDEINKQISWNEEINRKQKMRDPKWEKE